MPSGEFVAIGATRGAPVRFLDAPEPILHKIQPIPINRPHQPSHYSLLFSRERIKIKKQKSNVSTRLEVGGSDGSLLNGRQEMCLKCGHRRHCVWAEEIVWGQELNQQHWRVCSMQRIIFAIFVFWRMSITERRGMHDSIREIFAEW